MTREQAIRILDPETTIEALAEIEYYAGFSGQKAKVAACDEACKIAVADMRKLDAIEHTLSLVTEIPEEYAVKLLHEIKNCKLGIPEETLVQPENQHT